MVKTFILLEKLVADLELYAAAVEKYIKLVLARIKGCRQKLGSA